MHVSKLMGILAHIIRPVNHRERSEGWTEKKKKRFPPMLKRGGEEREKEVEKSIVVERGGVKG